RRAGAGRDTRVAVALERDRRALSRGHGPDRDRHRRAPDRPDPPQVTKARDQRADVLRDLAAEIVGCRLCPRLVAWREAAAANPPARFTGAPYWARPLPGFGDARARVLVVGLAPAAPGGNRPARIFTRDRSGDFLCASLHRMGFASQATSVAADDGLAVRDLYIAA